MPIIVVPAKDWANEIVRKIPRHLDGDSHCCRRNGRSGRCNEQDAAKQVPAGRNDGKRMQDAALRQTCGDKLYRLLRTSFQRFMRAACKKHEAWILPIL